jgi:uncharacterized protein (TIGR03000 family)
LSPCLVALVASAVAADDAKTGLQPIVITIHLPADAELEILGKKVDGTGETRRESVTPTKDAESLYVVKATWIECDMPRTVKKTLKLKPGQEAEVDLNLDLTADEKLILKLINAEREKAGFDPLVADPKLNRAARSHSLNMAKQSTLAHELDGKSAPDRMKDAGYRLRTYGENCGVGSRTPAQAVQMWMNSPPHKQNILTATFNETGLGIAVGKAGKKYYTQVFAVPAN